MSDLRRELVEELAVVEAEQAEASASDDLVHAADLRKAADVIKDRLFRMASEPEEHEGEYEEWVVEVTCASDPSENRVERLGREKLEFRWPWLRDLLWNDPGTRESPTHFVSMEFTVDLYHVTIKLLEERG